jgi:hypothetical protein
MMELMELFLIVLFLSACVVGFSALLFGLGHVLSAEWIGRTTRDVRHWQVNLWHIMAAVVVAALLLHAFAFGPNDGGALSIGLLCLLTLAWFVRAWRKEFVFLMGLRDDDFPGRNDKLIWAIVLLVFAPFCVWFFRSYRLAHWPQREPAAQVNLNAGPGTVPVTQPA